MQEQKLLHMTFNSHFVSVTLS